MEHEPGFLKSAGAEILQGRLILFIGYIRVGTCLQQYETCFVVIVVYGLPYGRGTGLRFHIW